jgi:cation-transporting P-type ATPase E
MSVATPPVTSTGVLDRAERGLSEVEAAARLAARGPQPKTESSRSYASIVRANVFTVFNVILAAFGALTLAFGEWQDALFLGVIFFNSAIGITQEVRAKHALDRLAALVVATATVVRDGVARQLAVGDVLRGDLVRIAPGDQVVADGVLGRCDDLQLDESILTGESRPISRGAGEQVRSGAFVVEGTGVYRVDAVGCDSYASRIAGQARAFRHPRSPLELALNRLLLLLVALIVPLGGVAALALWERRTALHVAVTTATAEVVTLVPEGLILLASLTFAVSAMRMARRGALAQQLNAIESLASVDVICLDKTGTLTEPGLRVVDIIPAAGYDEGQVRELLGAYAASSPHRNGTLEAIAAALPAEPQPVGVHVPFSSRRRWSGLELRGRFMVLGAPELFALDGLEARAGAQARHGRRVIAFGVADAPTGPLEPDTPLPPGAMVVGLAVLGERLRKEAAQTVRFFQAQGVELKILSGDDPETVAAIARDAGVELAGPPAAGDDLPEDPKELQRTVLALSVVGRISPEGKRRVVEALSAAGRYVAMVGDGVNDVPALKAARLAIAQGTGTQMAKAVADVVLVKGDFAAVPAMVAEGRQVLRNVQRVAKLFLSKSAFASFLILSIGLTPTAYPLLPRHLTLVASLTIGIPAFFLALAPSAGPYRSCRFLRETAQFAVPAGTAAGLGVLASYLFALNVVDLPLRSARTVAATVLIVVGLYLVLSLEAAVRARRRPVIVLCAAMAALYGAALALPFSRNFFELAVPMPKLVAIALAGAAIAVTGLVLTDDRFSIRAKVRRTEERR